MFLENVQILETLGGVSPAEGGTGLMLLLGAMTTRFNILESKLFSLIGVKNKIFLMGELYDYISKRMTFLPKVRLLGDFVPKEIKIRLEDLNNKRNKIIHSLCIANDSTKKISIQYKKETIMDVSEFVSQINQEISDLSNKIHNILTFSNKLGERTVFF